ncbi:MAG: lytic transglycosylase domain-containing protein, partial [Calditrichaceae bacterium]
MSNSFIEKADSVADYYQTAKTKLREKDTIGAEIYYEQAFEILSNFSEQDRLTLQYWDRYDTLFMSLSDDYEKIYIANNTAMEAEEIREDIIDMVELDIPDSILFGDGTIIDSSGEIPITINNKVRMAIKYFQTRGRVVFTRWLERSGAYEDLVFKIFEEKGVPKDLAYVAMIESGFNPKAHSYARAVGMWQFISATGRFYGLRHDWWFDERRDVIKSTVAAAEHFLDLYKRFDDWYLALAGYNCNPKRVEYNMRRYKTNDFWRLRRLPRQTRNYVPTYLAATIIAKNPKKFGFFVDKHNPVETDVVKISESVDLNV